VATPVEIVSYEPRYSDDFKRLNIEWLERYFRVEPIDVEVLSKPEAILAAGGFILMARSAGTIIGTCAVMHAEGTRFELTKMAVTAAWQGQGVGRQLLVAALAAFRARGGGDLFLETNSRLAPAIALYESLGFVHAPRPEGPSHYERADVYMDYRPPIARPV
jgi:ribosomal protein S18 acetylase RimI-like enzyme